MEHWDIYDQNRIKTGKIATRGSKLQEGEYHLVVHVCIFNSKDEMLIQQRQSFKEGWPNMWDLTVGGSAVVGESNIQAAERETLEELGLKIDLSKERPYFTINFSQGFDDYYLIERDIELSELTLQYDEVQNVKWASKDDIMMLIKEGKFIDYYFIEPLFEMRHRRGSHRS